MADALMPAFVAQKTSFVVRETNNFEPRATPSRQLFCASMSNLGTAHETKIEAVISDFVRRRLALGIYDPAQIRRPKVEIASFQIELLEIDETDSVAHAAGPVVLRTPQGDVEISYG